MFDVSPDVLDAAAELMRSSVSESRDGVADVLAELSRRVHLDAEGSGRELTRLCVIDSRDAFSVFVVGGVSDIPGCAAMPPRLLVVRRDSTGREIIHRNQVGCAEFLASIPLPVEDRGPRSGPRLVDIGTPDVVGRHMSHLSHWDARPERIVALLDALADFLSGGARSAEEILSDLCLSSLEMTGRSWAKRLSESRDLAGLDAAGLAPAVAALRDRPVWEVDEIRREMEDLLDWRVVEDAGASKTLHDRIVAVIHGTGEADLPV